MKTYYCVTSSFDDRGHVVAAITATCQADTKPESTYKSTSRKDIYNDWFETRKAAELFVKGSKNAQHKRSGLFFWTAPNKSDDIIHRTM